MARSRSLSLAMWSCVALLAGDADAAPFGADQGKLLLTAGFSTVEGSGGGALTPWSLISGYGSADSFGANVHATGIRLRDFELQSIGIAVGAFDRLEFSASRQSIQLQGTALDYLEFSQQIYGLKLRVSGDAVYDQDSWLPQIAIGAQIKRRDGDDPRTLLQARDDDGVDFHLSATKLDLARSLLINATVRYSKANQFGLLGFGGDRRDDWRPQLEASVGYLLSRSVAFGAEYRHRSANLALDREEAAWDAFIAWAPTRNISIVAAYVNAGSILAPLIGKTRDQDGAYLSVQAGF